MKRGLITRVIVSILCVLMGAGAPGAQPAKALEEADAMEPNRITYQTLMEDLRIQHERHPNEETIAFAYAEKMYQLGNFTQAQAILAPLLGKNPYPQAVFLSAQMEYAGGRYAEAEALYLELVNHYPELKVQAEYGLGMVYYQTNQFHKAQGLSAASDPEFSIGSLMRAFGDRTPYQIEWIEPAGDQATIPFVKTDPLPLIQADIDGKAYCFIIDTGAPEIHLDNSLAASLGIEIIGKYEGVYAGGVTAEINYGILDSIVFPGVRIKSVPVILHPSEAMEAQSALYEYEGTIAGIVGTGFLKQFLATVDYPEGRLILRPRAGQGIAREESAMELPFVMATTHILLGRGQINGKEVNVFMDSGLAVDGASILVPQNTIPYADITVLDTVKTEGVGGGGATELEIGILTIDAFRLGDLPEARDEIALSGIFPEAVYFDSDIGVFVDSLLSHNFLKNYRWTLDFDSMRMTFSQ